MDQFNHTQGRLWAFFSLLGIEAHVIAVQLLSCVQLFMTPWTMEVQASLSFTISWSLCKLMSIELMMPSNHLILCGPFLLLPSIFPRVRVFSNESVLRIRWPKHWSFSFSISPSKGGDIYKLRRETSEESDPTDTFNSDFQLPEL